ncbi:hypothetical protein RIF29_24901 [Crotalaria pallida]|uniref:Uncharacterized protein n=1 Tax=Crotalaria pallida TaxID=3830 RepID=A0AAN9HYU3_CROPI
MAVAAAARQRQSQRPQRKGRRWWRRPEKERRRRREEMRFGWLCEKEKEVHCFRDLEARDSSPWRIGALVAGINAMVSS